jgi:hypothetical protein
MDHNGFMVGMLLGGALVASVPTLLVIGVGVYVLRQHRARTRADAAAGTPTEEVSP